MGAWHSLLKAYGFAYLYSTSPKVLSVLVSCLQTDRRNRRVMKTLRHILVEPLALGRFPTFCGALVGMYTFFQLPLRFVFSWALLKFRGGSSRDRSWIAITASRFFAALVAAWFSLQMLNKPSGSKKPSSHLNIPEAPHAEASICSKPIAGRTMDLTLFAVVRSIETIIGNIWSRHQSSRAAHGRWTQLEQFISRYVDASVFAASSGMIMWAWIYYPYKLPRAYDKWIKGAAQVDRRLIEVLRQARRGEFVYGRKAEGVLILESMCREFQWPLEWGDPSKTIPIPCEVVHTGLGPSCHWHAAVRFLRTFRFALATYLPLQLLIKMRSPSWKAFWRALKEALRSSAFLGAFVGLFWYGVCLSRTQLGPRILSSKRVTPMMWDGGLCIRAGCLLCGWSILIEAAKRRQEVAFFVAPKAAATLLPRSYDRKYLWREKAAFSVSIGVLFSFAQHDSAKVRGMLGRLLHGVLA